MDILTFLLSHWDSVLVVLLAAVGIIVLIAKRQYAILDKIIFSLVTEAEKKFGGGTGAAKLAAVIDWVYPKIPAVSRLFISEAQFEKLIERVLDDAKERWERTRTFRHISATTKSNINSKKPTPVLPERAFCFILFLQTVTPRQPLF